MRYEAMSFGGMSSDVVRRSVMWCDAMSCEVMSRDVIWRRAVWRDVMRCAWVLWWDIT